MSIIHDDKPSPSLCPSAELAQDVVAVNQEEKP